MVAKSDFFLHEIRKIKDYRLKIRAQKTICKQKILTKKLDHTLKKIFWGGPKIIQIADKIIHLQKCKKNIPSYTGIIQRYTAIIQRYTAIIQLRRSGEAKIIQVIIHFK